MQATQSNDFTTKEVILAVSFELSKGSWKLALHDGRREKASIYTVKDEDPAKRLDEAIEVIKQQKIKWGLPETTTVAVVYEAGQDGFWIYRALSKLGFDVKVVDAASIPVERRARRAKTDRLDSIMLVFALLAWLNGERGRMHVIKVPSEAAEAQRQIVRDRGELQKESQQHRDRIRKLLRTVGCWDKVDGYFTERLEQGELKCHDGGIIPSELNERLTREVQRLELVEEQLSKLEEEMISQLPEPIQARVAHLQNLKGIGRVGAVRLVLELFWRKFDNRRQVGSCVGLVPQPYDSGQSRVDQSISKQGNRRVRALLIEMSWFWLRYQPGSAISQWFIQRTEGNTANKRGKRIAIVAVARRMVIALWRYLEDGVIPEGAVLKTI